MASAHSRRTANATPSHTGARPDALQRAMAPGATREAPRNVILQGDALAVLRDLPEACVQCIVTSPPYWSLRDYGVAPTRWPDIVYVPMPGLAPIPVTAMTCALGLEPSIEAFIGHLVLIFRGARRVLRDDGTAWVNIGDSYNAYNGNAGLGGPVGLTASIQRPHLPSGYGRTQKALAEKNMLMAPARLALALQADGWVVRMDVIWSKANPMPESVSDRPTRAHEYLWLLSKNPRYFYDAEAIKETVTGGTHSRGPVPNTDMPKTVEPGKGIKNNKSFTAATWNCQVPSRNRRSVWTTSSEAMPAAHFATFPTALVRPAILAGSAKRACESCGAPWMRVVEQRREPDPTVGHNALRGAGHMRESAGGPANREGREFLRVVASETTGWVPTCACEGNTGAARSLVLDPFAGAGTVPLVAKLTGRDYLGIELNPEYVKLAERRIQMFGRLGRGQPPPKAGAEAPPSLWDGVAMGGDGVAGHMPEGGDQ